MGSFSIWTMVNLIPVAGPIVATIGKAIMSPVSHAVCFLSKQPDHVISAVCTMLSGTPCQ